MALQLDNYKQNNITKKYDIYKYWQQSYDPYTKGIPVAFFTTPVMNLTANNYTMDNYFTFMKTNYPDVYCSLTAIDPTGSNSITPSTSPFIKILSNSFKGLDGKDLNSKTFDIGETFSGYKQTLPGSYIDSIMGDTVSVKYADSKNLHIIHLHKIWMEYIENVSRGKFAPYAEIQRHAELDYVSTLYYFVLDYDFETILYFCRYTGIAPISNPYSSLTTTMGEGREIPQIDIEYVYSAKQDLSPDILIDFNRTVQNDYSSLRGGTNTASTYSVPSYEDYTKDRVVDLSKSIYDGQPIICKHKTGNTDGGINPKYQYKLVFK